MKSLNEVKMILESSKDVDFSKDAHELIASSKQYASDYGTAKMKKIEDLAKLIDTDSKEDKKKFVKSIVKLLGMSSHDLSDALYAYH